MSDRSTVFVVDDDPAVRDSLALLLEEGNLAVETFDSAEAFLTVSHLAPRSCAVVDVRMPGMDGIRLQIELTKRGVALPVIFLSGHGDIPMSVRAMRAGAVDFLVKPVTGAALLDSVHAALGESDRLNAEAAASKTATARVASLTAREREVMSLVVKGLSNKEIGRHLRISHRTVEIHKAGIMRKTNAETLIALVRLAEQADFESR